MSSMIKKNHLENDYFIILWLKDINDVIAINL